MEITAEKLIELVEEKESWRCTAIDFENEKNQLLNQVKALKGAILERCYSDYSYSKTYYDHYTHKDLVMFMACGITVEEIETYVNSRLAEVNKDE